MTFTRSVMLPALALLPFAPMRCAAEDAVPMHLWSSPGLAAAEAAKPPAKSPAKAKGPTAAPVPPAPMPAKAPARVEPIKPAAQTVKATPADAPVPAASSTTPDAPTPPKAEETATAKDAPAKDAKKKAPPAKALFGAAKLPANLTARAIGWYAKGCLAGGKALPIDGPAWQVMRLSRNRNWGHPQMVALVERLATEVKAKGEWPGLLVGDLAQPRGGPMTSGHASHQVGLDADVWLNPMPDRTLSAKEREDISATSMLAADEISVDPKIFGDGQVKLIKRAASYREVERVLVHPAIKKALCEASKSDTDRGWLTKVRPYWGHHYHMHIRIGCPAGSTNCKSQPPVPGDDGCGAELTDWIKKVTPKKKKEAPPVAAKPSTPEPKRHDITLAELPADCRTVLAAGEKAEPPATVASDKGAPDAAKPAAVRASAVKK